MDALFFWVFALVCIGLGYLGAMPPEGGYLIAGRVLTAYYFIHFLVILPLLGLFETPKPVPNSIADAVLAKHNGGGAAAALATGAASGPNTKG